MIVVYMYIYDIRILYNNLAIVPAGPSGNSLYLSILSIFFGCSMKINICYVVYLTIFLISTMVVYDMCSNIHRVYPVVF